MNCDTDSDNSNRARKLGIWVFCPMRYMGLCAEDFGRNHVTKNHRRLDPGFFKCLCLGDPGFFSMDPGFFGNSIFKTQPKLVNH